MTGEDAAVKVQKERGHVVIGCPPQDAFPKIGSQLETFAGAPLLMHNLLVIGETDRRDWEQQVAAIFGKRHPATKKHPPAPGERFFSCTLQEDESCAPSR